MQTLLCQIKSVWKILFSVDLFLKKINLVFDSNKVFVNLTTNIEMDFGEKL